MEDIYMISNDYSPDVLDNQVCDIMILMIIIMISMVKII